MNRIKLLLEKNYTTILLVVGFVLSCFVAVNVLSLLNSIQSMQQSNKNNSYKYQYTIEAFMDDEPATYSDKKLDEFVNELRCKKGNVCMFGMYSIIGEGLKNPCTYISLSKNEDMPMNIIWGRMPSKKEIDNKKHVIMVGTSLEEYIKDKNGKKYIYLDGIKYEVTGVFVSDLQIDEGKRMDLFTYYECIDSKLRKNVESFTNFLLQFSYGSSIMGSADIEENVQNIQSTLKKYEFDQIDLKDDHKDKDNTLLNAKIRLNKYFMYVTFGFTLVNCMVISNVWVKKRYNEFVIRRTFGYSMMDMVRLLLKDLAVYGVIAMALGIVIQTAYAVAFGKNHLQLKYVGENVIYLCIVLILVLLAAIFIPVMNIRKILPAAEIRRQKK